MFLSNGIFGSQSRGRFKFCAFICLDSTLLKVLETHLTVCVKYALLCLVLGVVCTMYLNRIKFKCCSTPRHIRFHDTFSNLRYESFQNEFIRLSNKYFSLCLDFHRMTFYFGVIHFCSSALSLEYNCSICSRITQQVLTFPSNCSNCNSPVETRMKVVGILYEYRACFILFTA